MVYPSHRRVKARKVRYASRRLTERYGAYQSESISFAEFNATVQAWINYVPEAGRGLQPRPERLHKALIYTTCVTGLQAPSRFAIPGA